MSIAEKLTEIAESLPKVYDAGKDYQNNELWKAITANGTRTDYSGAFRYQQWNKNNFIPTCDITPTNASYMFRSLNPETDDLQIDMEELEKTQGIKFDFSKCVNFVQAFSGGLFSTLNVIDMSTSISENTYAFYGAYTDRKLKRINKLILGENTKPHNSWFGYCPNLIHIGFEGILTKNGLDVSSCVQLDKESITKLIGILSSNTSGLTVTFSTAAVNAAFGIDVNDESTFPEGSEYHTLRNTKLNWIFNYA